MLSRVVTVVSHARGDSTSSLGRRQPHERLLDDVLGLAEAADHPVGDREHQRSQIFVCHSQPACLVCTDMNTLRIFLAGASGTLGRRLVPQLVARGHQVVGTTRSPERAAVLEELGAEPVIVDPLDARAVRDAVVAARPDVVVHQLTALAGMGMSRNFDRTFAATNRLRTEGTDHLIAAARAAGARRLVWQSYAGWPYAREGGPIKTEDDPLDPEPPADARESLAAIRYLEARRAWARTGSRAWSCATAASTGRRPRSTRAASTSS